LILEAEMASVVTRKHKTGDRTYKVQWLLGGRNGRGEFAFEQHGRFYLDKPKTRESRRRITLAPLVAAAFERAVA
jgi:hypothetical protein